MASPRLALVGVLGLLVIGCGASRPAELVARASVADGWWPRLREGLTGEWTTTTPSGRPLTVRYRALSRGSALAQAWAPGTGGETLTVLHPDGDAILLTHYCGQGNQARLAAVEATGDAVRFERFEVTNATPEQSVLTVLTLRLAADGATHEHVETYEDAEGHAETTTLVFHRVQ